MQRNEVQASKSHLMLCDRMATALCVDPQELFDIVAKHTISVKPTEPAATPEEMTIALSECNRMGLSPLANQITFFRGKGGKLCKMVLIDGWTELANTRPNFKGVSVKLAPPEQDVRVGYLASRKQNIQWPGNEPPPAEFRDRIPRFSMPCAPWCEATVEFTDRRPLTVRCRLIEVYNDPRYDGAWQDRTEWRLQQKTIGFAIRLAFGFAAYDEDDMAIIRERASLTDTARSATASAEARVEEELGGVQSTAEQPVEGDEIPASYEVVEEPEGVGETPLVNDDSSRVSPIPPGSGDLTSDPNIGNLHLCTKCGKAQAAVDGLCWSCKGEEVQHGKMGGE